MPNSGRIHLNGRTTLQWLRGLSRRSSRSGSIFSRVGFDFLFPRSCAYCGQSDEVIVDAPAFEPMLCGDCRENLASVVENQCSRCGAPVGPNLDSSAGCIYCHGSRFVFEKVLCLGIYDKALRHACWRAKKPWGDAVTAALAGLLWERAHAALSQAGIDVVIPVPQHWRERLWSENNAPTAISRALARRLQVDFCRHILFKTRHTPAQADLPPHKRRTNLKGAFGVPPATMLSGRTVLLVDDILTTGSTANEASRALARAGAGRVVVAVLARGLGASSRA